MMRDMRTGLTQWAQHNNVPLLGKKRKKKKQRPNNKEQTTKHSISETLSERDLQELMGMNERGYYRKRGSFRQR